MNFFKPKFWDNSKLSLLSIVFFPITLILKLLFFMRCVLTKNHQFKIPVICVGNIYLGGTGKTPLCIEIFSILKKLNKKPAFIRKKYNSFQDEVNQQQKVGPVYQNKKRINAINDAIENKADVVILDDGFQDFSVKKNLSIVCFNEKQWVGNGMIIPSGPLRENLSSLKRANLVFINGKKNTIIENKLYEKNNKLKVFYTNLKSENIDDFKNKNVIAFAGIGNPMNFFSFLKENNVNILEEIGFPDHYNYSDIDLKGLISKAKKNNSILLSTEKDYLRIGKNYQNKINFLKVKTEIENKNSFIEEIKKII